ncbi:MAG: hypothetical protein Fur0018_14630 [Anaerolineales bacterium]
MDMNRLRCTARTWYGLPVEITVSSDHFHRVAVPGLAIPHPGLVNAIVRRGLPTDIRLELTTRHELGHLQTLPVPLLHLLFMLWPRRGRASHSLWLRLLLGLLAHQAAWEMAAESYLVLKDARSIHAPRRVQNRVLYVFFWCCMALVALWSTSLISKREEV